MKRPESLNTLGSLGFSGVLRDSVAALSLLMLTLPLAVVCAIAAGMSPVVGLVSAVAGGFIVSALGGSRFQIAGPSAIISVFIYSIFFRYGFPALQLVSVIAGLILVLIGILRLGGLVHFIPYTLVTGYTAGVAVLIAFSAVGDLVGIKQALLPAHFSGKLSAVFSLSTVIHPATVITAVVVLGILFLWDHWIPRFSGILPVLILATVVAWFFDFPFEMIGSRYPSELPRFSFLLLADFRLIQDLFPKAFPLALLIAVESLSSGLVADGLTGYRHNANTDLCALGVANIVCPLLGGIPVSCSLERTTANIRSGASSPLSGMTNACFLLGIMLFFAPMVAFVPLPAIAAVLIHLSWSIVDTLSIRSILRGQKKDIAVMLVTFGVTVFFSLTIALSIGLLLVIFFSMQKMIPQTSFSVIRNQLVDADIDTTTVDSNSLSLRAMPPEVLVFEVSGPLIFGTVQKFKQAIVTSCSSCRVIILRMINTVYLDNAGVGIIAQFDAYCKKKGIALLLSDIHTQPYICACETGLDVRLGPDAIFGNLDEALVHALDIIGLDTQES